jgi:hypothetical protein
MALPQHPRGIAGPQLVAARNPSQAAGAVALAGLLFIPNWVTSI